MPIVVLEGLRATGKTTLARAAVPPDRFFDLTDQATLARATSDPLGWLEALPFGSAVDEAQLVPGLTLVAKTLVDQRGGSPGQFLFTGSSKISRTGLGGTDPLVGRARWLRIEPLAQCEIEGTPRDVISALFDDDPRSWTVDPVHHRDLTARFVGGGLPTLRLVDDAALGLQLDQFGEGLFGADAYQTGKNRDGILRLFRHLCAASSDIKNFQNIQRKTELRKETVHGYLDDLSNVFLIGTLEGYKPDAAKRITEKQRLFVTDPAFAAVGLGVTRNSELFDSEKPEKSNAGKFLETVVATELRRLTGWSRTARLKLLHWRVDSASEVDVVVERADEKVLAIEVKAARKLGRDADKGVNAFRKQYPDTFHRGFVIHAGDHVEQLSPTCGRFPSRPCG